MLSASGHIAGIINPPVANKYCYWTNDKNPEKPDEWFDGSQVHDGSWWGDWQNWVNKHAGPQVKKRIPGDRKLKSIEDAPGSYVLVRSLNK